MAEIESPGSMNDYESEKLFYEALDKYRDTICEVIGVTSEELHSMGPQKAKELISNAFVEF